jgi:hypothetical protein
VQTQLLDKNPETPLRVYAVWVPLPISMTRDKWDAANMPDARVREFWDVDQVISGWFGSQVDGLDGLSWDMYYLYGPDAVWDTVPTPLIRSGGSIYAERERLRTR